MKKLIIILFLLPLSISLRGQVVFEQLAAAVQTTINGKFSTVDTNRLLQKSDTSQLLAKRDTQKLANGIRNSIQPFTAANFKQVIADSCYTASFDLNVASGATDDTTLPFGKTIQSPVLTRLTINVPSPISTSLTGFFIYVSSLGTTSAVLHFYNSSSATITPRVNVQVCPNGF